MKRIKNADINFKVNPKRINLNNFSMKFYTVNSEAYFFTKDQNNLVSVERDATIYDEDVIISGGTKVLDYYLPLDWSELVQLGEGVLNYRCINNIEDPYFPDMAYNQVIEDTTGYYIDSDIIVDPSQTRNIIERVTELESGLAVESIDREEADTTLSGMIETETARAISAETELSERIDTIESASTEALDNEIARATSAETALQDNIDAEEARAIAIENAIRQDLTDESELRSSADTAMWTAIDGEVTRSVSADTALQNAIDVENLRAIAQENAISGNLETYKATNNAALAAETTRATSAETALQTAIGNEVTARENADTALSTRIDNLTSASTAAIDAEEARAKEAESGITRALNTEIARAISAETTTSNALNAEITRAISAETALDGRINELTGITDVIFQETIRASRAEQAISGAVDTEVARATSAETALQTAIDELSSASTAAIDAEIARATSAETQLGNRIDSEASARTDADTALSNKIDSLSGSVDTIVATKADKVDAVASAEYVSTAKTINFKNISGTVISTIDATDFIKDGMIDSVELESKSGTTYLVITWNTDAGKQKTELNIGDLFEADNYYTKTEIDNTVSGINASIADEVSARTSADTALQNAIDAEASARTDADTAINGKIDAISGAVSSEVTRATSAETELQNAINTKLAISDFNTYSGAVDTAINSKASQSDLETLSGAVEDNEQVVAQAFNVLNAELATKLDASAYTPCDLSQYWTSAQTNSAITQAVSGKQDILVAGDNITISGNVISASDTYISGVTVGNVLPKPNIEPNTTTITFLDGTVLTGQSLDLRTITNITNAVRIDANVQGRNILQDSDGDLDLHNLEILTIQMSNIDVYQPYAYVGICPYAFSNTELGRIDNSKLKVYIYCDTPTDVYFKTYDEINDAAFRGGSSTVTYPIYVPNVEEFSNSVVRSDRNYDNITWGQLFGNRLHQMTGVEKILKFSYNADKEDIMLPTSAITDGISIEASSAITEGDTNPVQGGVLYDELRIGSETEVTLEWLNYDGGETTNYPSGSGCSKITFEVVESGETEGNEWNQTEGWFSVSDIEGNVYIGINDGVVTASAENGFPATCSVNGNIVTVEYPTIVDNVEKWYSSYDNHWVTKAVFLGGTPVRVIDQVTANTASIANKLDSSAYTPTDLSQYWTSAQTSSAINQATSGKVNSNDVYLKSETSGATQIATAIAAKADPYTAGTGIDITNNVISVTGGTGGGISSAECQTMIDQSISGKADSSDVTSEITAAVSGKADTSSLATVATSGSYNDLSNKPTIPTYTAGSGITISNNVISAKIWSGTQVQFDAITNKDNDTIYLVY